MNEKMRLPIILFALVTTGFASMVYEVILLRELSIILGSTLFASSSVLSVVMIGLFAGSWYLGKKSTQTNSLNLLISIEFIIAVIALFLIILVRNLAVLRVWPLEFIFACILIFPPAFFMGGEIPVAIQAISPYYKKSEIGKISGRIYAADTFGGAAGALIATFVLVPLLGCLRSVWFGGLLNTISGLALLFCFPKEERVASDKIE